MHHSAQPIRGRLFHSHHEPRSINGAGTHCQSTNPFGLSPTAVLISSPLWTYYLTGIMTLEEVAIQKPSERAQCTGKALEEVLVSAKANEYLTIGVYESAKVMNV